MQEIADRETDRHTHDQGEDNVIGKKIPGYESTEDADQSNSKVGNACNTIDDCHSKDRQ